MLLEILKKRIDVPGLVADILDQVAEPALDKFVADTSNPFDDTLKAALYPMLSGLIKDEVEKLWEKIIPSDVQTTEIKES